MSKLYKILLVDDEQDILEFLSYNLEREGFKVFTAINGKIAIEQAKKGFQIDEVPIGAVLVDNIKQNIIASFHNEIIKQNNPIKHAEILVIEKACKLKNSRYLVNTSIFITLEPCAMCLGALVHARISNIVFGAFDFKTGVCGSCVDLTSAKFFNHTIKIDGGVLEDDCMILMKSFFSKRR